MPVNDHLTWVEIKDFHGGLWNASSGFLAPANTFQTMVDCEPQQQGGLRAFWAPTAIGITGLVDATKERMLSIHTQFLATGGESTMLTTVNPVDLKVRAYYKSVLTSGNWVLKRTFAAFTYGVGASIGGISHYDDGTNYYFVLWSTGDTGLWLYNPATDAWTNVASPGAPVGVGPCTNYQGRLVVATLNELWWTDPGGITFPAANFLKLYQGQQDLRTGVTAFAPQPPSTLLVGTNADSWWSIEGDIGDPIVRQMGGRGVPSTAGYPAATDDGTLFWNPGVGTYLANNSGGTFERVDLGIQPVSITPLAALYAPHFGVAATGARFFAPGGYVYNRDTKSWFQVSQEADTTYPIYDFYERLEDQVLGVQYDLAGGGAANIYLWDMRDHSFAGGTRVTTYNFKTAPIRNDKGRWAHIREVQFAYFAFGTAATISVTIGGVTRTTPTLAAGNGEVSLLFPDVQGRYLDIAVTAASNSSSEAPMIEAMRIGARSDAHEVF